MQCMTGDDASPFGYMQVNVHICALGQASYFPLTDVGSSSNLVHLTFPSSFCSSSNSSSRPRPTFPASVLNLKFVKIIGSLKIKFVTSIDSLKMEFVTSTGSSDATGE